MRVVRAETSRARRRLAAIFAVGLLGACSQMGPPVLPEPYPRAADLERATDPPATAGELTLATWNVGFTPIRKNAARAPKMGAAIARLWTDHGVDVVGLNEGFTKEPMERLLEAAQMRCSSAESRLPRRSGRKILNGGLAILAHTHRIVALESTPWDTCTNLSLTFDCPAAKGILFSRLAPKDDPSLRVNVFAVHLNAGIGYAKVVRRRQLVQLRKFMEAHSGPYPTFVMGDFNISGRCRSCETADDESLLDVLTSEVLGRPRDTYIEEGEGFVNSVRCRGASGADGGVTMKSVLGRQRLDFILFYPAAPPGRNWEVRYQPGSHTVHEMCIDETRTEPGSDHFAVSASFRFHRRN